MEKLHGGSGGGVEGRLTGVEGRLTGVEGRLTVVEGDVREIKVRMDGLATKEDLQKLEGEVHGIKVQMKSLATKEDLKDLKVEILEAQQRQLWWVVSGVSAAFVMAITGIATFLAQFVIVVASGG